jgi:putative DNA primase/helicase
MADEKKETLKKDIELLIVLKNNSEVTERLAEYIISKNHIYTTIDDNRPECWIYKEGIYIPNGKFYIEEEIREILSNRYHQRWANLVFDKIKIDTMIEKEKFFTNNYIYDIPVLNGILDIITKTLQPFDPQKIFFNKLPIQYNPKSKCPIIDKFLSDILAHESDRKVFYEIGGFCLLKEYRFEKAFMFLGSGRNGKSKCLELLKRTIGAENCFSLPLVALTYENANLSQLFGKMINLAGDIGYEDLKDTSTFKALTGRDLITTSRKFLTAITFENFAKFIFSCNQLPKVYDMSKAFWDRWVLINFPFYFATQDEMSKKDSLKDINTTNWKLRDESIIDKIAQPDELSGLLNEFLEGLDRLLTNKSFSTTKGTEDVKLSWLRVADSFFSFCNEHIIEKQYDSKKSHEATILKKYLRNKYKDYCIENNLKISSDKYIYKFLTENYSVEETQTSSNYERVWLGIEFKETSKYYPKED